MKTDPRELLGKETETWLINALLSQLVGPSEAASLPPHVPHSDFPDYCFSLPSSKQKVRIEVTRLVPKKDMLQLASASLSIRDDLEKRCAQRVSGVLMLDLPVEARPNTQSLGEEIVANSLLMQAHDMKYIGEDRYLLIKLENAGSGLHVRALYPDKWDPAELQREVRKRLAETNGKFASWGTNVSIVVLDSTWVSKDPLQIAVHGAKDLPGIYPQQYPHISQLWMGGLISMWTPDDRRILFHKYQEPSHVYIEPLWAVSNPRFEKGTAPCG